MLVKNGILCLAVVKKQEKRYMKLFAVKYQRN